MPQTLPGYHGSYSQAGIPQWLQDLYARMGHESAELSQAQPTDIYQGNTVAGVPQLMHQAHQMSQGMVGSYQPHVQAARHIANRAATTTFPQMAQQYMDPYQQHVLDRIAVEGNRNFTENILPELEGKFVGLGQHGSSMHADLARRAARDAAAEIAGTQAKYLSQGYGQAAQHYGADMAKSLEAAKELSAIGAYERASGAADIQQLERIAAYNQAQEQARINAELEKFQAQETNKRNKLADLSQILAGQPLTPYQINLQKAQNAPQMNFLGNAADVMKNLGSTLMATGHKKGGFIRKKKGGKVSLRQLIERKL